MLGIFDKNQHLLHSFETLEQAGGIEFYIQQKELLDVFEDDMFYNVSSQSYIRLIQMDNISFVAH